MFSLTNFGHHVQNLLGIERKVRSLQGQNPGAGNSVSVRMELQADGFAGVWAKSTQQRNLLESGDIESALGAAAALGDRSPPAKVERAGEPGFIHAWILGAEDGMVPNQA